MNRTLFFRRPFKKTYFGAFIILILINFILYGIAFVFPKMNLYLSLNPIAVIKYKMYWQFVSYMFVHGNFSHLFFNMLGLLIFGFQLERAIGSKEFLLFYLLTGIFSGIFSFGFYMATGEYNVFLVGASGALYAVMFAFAVFFPRSVIYVWGIIPIPSPLLVVIYAVVELGSQIIGAGGNIAHMTHLFGFLAAWLYFVIRMGVHPIKIWKDTYHLR